jgi:hypothetical protein
MQMDDAIHDWAVIDPTTVRKCRKCGVYEWWFGCRREWRRDIPVGMFHQLTGAYMWGVADAAREMAGYIDLRGKFKWVSEPKGYEPDGLKVRYQRLAQQPPLPDYQKPKGVKA